jgi:hypothetical protein
LWLRIGKEHCDQMNISEQLIKDGILSAEQGQSINDFERDKAMTVHWELKTILYLGILLFMGGLGILVYLNIDTIGHTAIIAALSIACGYCFFYGFKNRKPYTHDEVKYGSPLFDYVVLLGCLLFGLLIGYTQYQYSVFGYHYGVATLLPAVLFLASAYMFDHKGILSLGITGLAAWAGVSVTPLHLLESNDFSSMQIIYTAFALGLALAGFSKWADTRGIKKHFGFTYNNFGCNLLFIACLAYLFNDDMPLRFLAFLFLGAFTFYFIKYAIAERSFLFLLLSILYGYIGLTYVFFMLLSEFDSAYEVAFMLGLFYIVASCAGIVLFFIYYKRILGIKK